MHAEVFADGPTRVLRLTDTSIFLVEENFISSPYSKERDVAKKQIVIQLNGIGISLIDDMTQVLILPKF